MLYPTLEAFHPLRASTETVFRVRQRQRWIVAEDLLKSMVQHFNEDAGDLIRIISIYFILSHISSMGIIDLVNNFHRSLNINRVIKSRRLIWAGNVARME